MSFAETAKPEILAFLPIHKAAFRSLNHEWINKYFELEELDRQILEYPEKNILAKGGHILMAQYQGELVGTCALLKVSESRFELGKMAVTEKMQKLKIGQLLVRAAIEKARGAGAAHLVLYSHRKLEPALHVYRKFGFQEVPCPANGYKRADIKMELALD